MRRCRGSNLSNLLVKPPSPNSFHFHHTFNHQKNITIHHQIPIPNSNNDYFQTTSIHQISRCKFSNSKDIKKTFNFSLRRSTIFLLSAQRKVRHCKIRSVFVSCQHIPFHISITEIFQNFANTTCSNSKFSNLVSRSFGVFRVRSISKPGKSSPHKICRVHCHKKKSNATKSANYWFDPPPMFPPKSNFTSILFSFQTNQPKQHIQYPPVHKKISAKLAQPNSPQFPKNSTHTESNFHPQATSPKKVAL